MSLNSRFVFRWAVMLAGMALFVGCSSVPPADRAGGPQEARDTIVRDPPGEIQGVPAVLTNELSSSPRGKDLCALPDEAEMIAAKAEAERVTHERNKAEARAAEDREIAIQAARASLTNAGASTAEGDRVTLVEATGIGATAEAAQENALYSAVEQVVGVMVDAKTQTENDRIVKDQILTMSAGFVKDFKVISPPVPKGAVFEVQILASVRRSALLGEMVDKNVAISSDVKGEDIWAQAVTQGRFKEQADKMLAELLSFDPRKFCVEQLSNVELIHPVKLTEKQLKKGDSWMRVSIGIYVDMNEYAASYLPKLIRCLDSIGTCTTNSIRVNARRGQYGVNSGVSSADFNVSRFSLEAQDWTMDFAILQLSPAVFRNPLSKGLAELEVERRSYRFPPIYRQVLQNCIRHSGKDKVIIVLYLDENKAVVAEGRIPFRSDAMLGNAALFSSMCPVMCPVLQNRNDGRELVNYLSVEVTQPLARSKIKRITSVRLSVEDDTPSSVEPLQKWWEEAVKPVANESLRKWFGR